MSLKCIIIDDEQHCIDTLQWHIEKYIKSVSVDATFTSSKKAKTYLNKHEIDVVFLDIEMPELNGFELLKSIKKINFDIIFTTAYDEFAIKAFKISAIDYLLKPIDKNELITAIEKVENKQNNQLDSNQMDILFNAIKKNPLKERIAVPTQNGLNFIKIKEILYCISDSNYTNIYLENKSKILVTRTLKEVEAMLVEEGFFRIHHSHLINLQKIEKYIRSDGGYVVMDDKKTLSVSRSRKDQLLSIFG